MFYKKNKNIFLWFYMSAAICSSFRTYCIKLQWYNLNYRREIATRGSTQIFANFVQFSCLSISGSRFMEDQNRFYSLCNIINETKRKWIPWYILHVLHILPIWHIAISYIKYLAESIFLTFSHLNHQTSQYKHRSGCESNYIGRNNIALMFRGEILVKVKRSDKEPRFQVRLN